MKYLIYLRVSTERQDVETQEKMCMHYIKNKHPQGDFTYKIYADPILSTRVKLEKRVGLQEMLNALTKGCTVLVYKLDRLSRDIIEMVTIYRMITREYGGQIHSLTDPYCDDFSVGLMGIIAEQERKTISQRTKDKLKTKKENGERTGSVPHGYKLHETHMVPIRQGDQIVMKQGVLVPCKKELEAIRLMEEAFAMGSSYGQIAQIVNDRGYRNREGRPFHKMSIYRILQRSKQAKLEGQLQEGSELIECLG